MDARLTERAIVVVRRLPSINSRARSAQHIFRGFDRGLEFCRINETSKIAQVTETTWERLAGEMQSGFSALSRGFHRAVESLHSDGTMHR
jgi:hypothetical protein